MIKELEKMVAGDFYNPEDAELKNFRLNSKKLCYEYNSCNPDFEQKDVIIRKLLGSCQKNFCIEPSFYCDYGFNTEIGENFYSNHNLVILDCAKVVFGKNVFVGPNCGFYTACHPTNFEERINGIEFAKPITVGDNVWIGGNVCVLAGVTIGKNSVIGAGSVVVKDIPENVVALGNPCRVVKKLK